MAPSDTTPDSGVAPKLTLFCPDCGHQSRLDGDWHVAARGSPTRYCCPECANDLAW